MSTTKQTRGSRDRRPAVFWVTPALSVALGAAMGGAAWAGGQPGFAVFAFTLMLVLAAAVVLVARRSETVAGLLDRRDERITSIDRDATLVAGCCVIIAVIAATFWQLATGGDAQPYAWLGAVGGGTYVVALIVLRIRR
jgi:hypothetical protein